MPAPAHAAALAALLSLTGCCEIGPGRAAPRSAAEYDAHVAELLERAPQGFAAAAAPPFVVIGDSSPEAVRTDARELVTWAATRLKADYFDLDPPVILDIWLFNGEESYRHHVNVIFGGFPPSPYGYFSACDEALVINIALGGGTVIHEMVHAFMASNFPACPTWLNEGLASLYEHTEDRDGHLRGRINWRLPALQAAIRRGDAPRLDALLATSSGEFYHEDRSALHYAAARYLLYYLQEHDLLVPYYHRFYAAQAEDPAGIETLRAVLEEPDLARAQSRWEAFVARLIPP